MKNIDTLEGFDLQIQLRRLEKDYFAMLNTPGLPDSLKCPDYRLDDISDEIGTIMERLLFVRKGDYWINSSRGVRIYQDNMLNELWNALDLYNTSRKD
jgi:hypothetical protein